MCSNFLVQCYCSYFSHFFLFCVCVCVCVVFFKIFFLCGLKALLNLLQYCFCFMFWWFGPEACGILALRPGIELAPPTLEGKVSTMELPEKSLLFSQ